MVKIIYLFIFLIFSFHSYCEELTSQEKIIFNFVDLNKDNFDQVMERVAPRLQMKVENTLEGDDSVIEADLTFSSMKDFEPEALIEKVEPLAKLMETRTQLKDLLAKADRSRDLEALLKEVLQDADTVAALSKELGVSAEPKSE